MRVITKKQFLSSIFCPTMGWIIYHSHFPGYTSLYDQFQIEEGIEVGKRARNLFPKGH
jgi:hypothetical protein